MDCTHLDAFDPAGEVLDVDDLLDFSINDDDIGDLIEGEEYCAPSSSSSTSSLSGLCRSTQASEKDFLSRAPKGEDALCCPPDELAGFDWFSSFVGVGDETIPCSLEKAFIINKPAGGAGDGGGAKVDGDWGNERIVSYCFPEEEADTNNCSSTRDEWGLQKEERVMSVLRWQYKERRARSKRARTGGRVWTLSGRLVGGSHSHVLSGIGDEEEELEEEEGKRGGRRRRLNQSEGRKARGGRGRGRGRGREAEEPPRACSHCQVTKTPQWRAGPSGPKSLCNACGVRFKSGRLLPEYRPAASPTFVDDLHSNSHKKVLEMRRSKHHQDLPLTLSPSPSHSCLSDVS